MTTAGPLGAAALATEYAEKLLLGTTREVHPALAGRVHGPLDRVGRGARGPHQVHDGIAASVYASVGLGLRAGAQGLRVGDRAAERAGLGPRLEETSSGS